jgi:hypothetical protein
MHARVAARNRRDAPMLVAERSFFAARGCHAAEMRDLLFGSKTRYTPCDPGSFAKLAWVGNTVLRSGGGLWHPPGDIDHRPTQTPFDVGGSFDLQNAESSLRTTGTARAPRGCRLARSDPGEAADQQTYHSPRSFSGQKGNGRNQQNKTNQSQSCVRDVEPPRRGFLIVGRRGAETQGRFFRDE